MDKKIICNSSICHTEKVQFKVRIEELEERQKWICGTYLDCRARVKKLEEGIEKYLDDPEFNTEILTKLIEKEKELPQGKRHFSSMDGNS